MDNDPNTPGGGNQTPIPNPAVPVTTAPLPPAKDPLTPGMQTSEGRLAAIIAFLQALLVVITAFGKLDISADQKAALMQMITVTMTLTSSLYGFSRAYVKGAALKQ
jgi:hypothetical protein